MERLDCCQTPSLVEVRSVLRFGREVQRVDRCQSCQAWWFVRQVERTACGEGEETVTWWVRLTADEAKGRIDLEKLSGRPALRDDLAGLERIESVIW